MMLLGFLILFFSATTLPGFVGETLVKTPSGYVEIAQLKVDDEVFGINKYGKVSITTITHTISYDSNQFMVVAINQEEIIVARGQKFFLPLKDVWRKAKKLHEKDVVLAAFYESLTVQKLQTLHEPVTFYEIRLKHDHAFLITSSDIIVHNYPLFNIGVLLVCGGGKIAVEAIWAGVCLFGWWLGSKMCGSSKSTKLFTEPKSYDCNYPVQAINQFQDSDKDFQDIVVSANDQYLYREAKGGCNIVPSQHIPKISCGSSTCKPPMPGPYGTHIPSPKHGPVPKGNIAAGLNMEEGQKALDVSVHVEGQKQRVSVWGGKYIVFEPTRDGIWHNHIRPWSKVGELGGLSREMKEALMQAGIVQGSKGKIIKDMKLDKK